MMFFDDVSTSLSKNIIAEVKKYAASYDPIVDTLDVPDYVTIRQCKGDLQHKSEGVLFMDGELGRGISVKMKNDAIVFIIDTKGSFGESQVRQMTGRGSRSFGKCTGYYYQINKLTLSESALKLNLANKDKRSFPAGAPTILTCALKVFINVKSENGPLKNAKPAIMEALGE